MKILTPATIYSTYTTDTFNWMSFAFILVTDFGRGLAGYLSFTDEESDSRKCDVKQCA